MYVPLEDEMLREYKQAKSGYVDWIYRTQKIGNGNQLIEACENTELQVQYIKEMQLPEDTELDY